jgi:hypothetical protein
MSPAPLCRAAALVALGALACEDDSVSPEGSGGTSSNVVSCTDDARLDVYTDNMQKAGELGLLDFRFSDFVPAPPAKGSNTFNVQLTGVSGPVPGGLEVELFMPDHGHGSSIEPEISLDSASGTYTVTPLYLFMPGVWRVTFDALSSEALSSEAPAPIDTVDLHFCIEG